MKRTDLRLVSNPNEPSSRTDLNTITFARTASGIIVFHNGKIVSFGEATFLLTKMLDALLRGMMATLGEPRPHPVCAETDGDCA